MARVHDARAPRCRARARPGRGSWWLEMRHGAGPRRPAGATAGALRAQRAPRVHTERGVLRAPRDPGGAQDTQAPGAGSANTVAGGAQGTEVPNGAQGSGGRSGHRGVRGCTRERGGGRSGHQWTPGALKTLKGPGVGRQIYQGELRARRVPRGAHGSLVCSGHQGTPGGGGHA